MSRQQRSVFVVLLPALALLMPRLVLGQQFADAPEPKPAPAWSSSLVLIQPKAQRTHEFFDRQNIILLSAASAMRTADSAYTCSAGVGSAVHHADGSITVRREDMLPVNSCRGVVLMNAGFTAMGVGGSYLLHKMGRHKLERLPNWIVASVPALGIAYTATHRNHHVLRY